MSVRSFGNTAVVNFTRTSTNINPDGLKLNSKSRDTATLVKNGKGWQIVALQVSNEQAGNQENNQVVAEKQIGEVLTDWGNALGRRDTAALDKIPPADFMLVSPDGKLYANRAEYLEVVKNFPGEATITGKSQKNNRDGRDRRAIGNLFGYAESGRCNHNELQLHGNLRSPRRTLDADCF